MSKVESCLTAPSPSSAGCFVFTALLSLCAVARAADEPRDSLRDKATVDNMLGATLDSGIGPNRSGVTSLGARFVRLHPFVSRPGPSAAWVGYGTDGRLVFPEITVVDAGLLNIVGRAGVAAGAGGIELEVTVGLGVADTAIPIWGVGVLYGFPWFGVGVSTQYTMGHDRPAWLEAAQLSFRIQLPLDPCASAFSSCAP